MRNLKSMMFLLGLVLLLGLTSCSDEGRAYVEAWTACRAECPEVDEAAWEECLSRCRPPQGTPFENPQGWAQFNECLRACGNPYLLRERCLERCAKNLRECFGVE